MQQYLQSWVFWGQNRQNLVKRLGTCKNAVEYFRKRHIYLHYIQVCICLCKTNTSYLSLSIPSKPETSKFQGYHRCPKSQMQNPVLLHRHSRYGSQHPAGYKYPAPNIALSLDNIHIYIYTHTFLYNIYVQVQFFSFKSVVGHGSGNQTPANQNLKTIFPIPRKSQLTAKPQSHHGLVWNNPLPANLNHALSFYRDRNMINAKKECAMR